MSNTSPIDQKALLFGAKPFAERQSRPGELLFEFHVARTHRTYRCELRDHGPEYGVEAQFFDPIELLTSRRFDPRLDATRPSRELAIMWAEEMRRFYEAQP